MTAAVLNLEKLKVRGLTLGRTLTLVASSVNAIAREYTWLP